MSSEWRLIGQTTDAAHSHSIEVVRTLTDDELALLDAAQRTLSRLTATSPYQVALDAYQTMVAAFNDHGRESTESAEVREGRALHTFIVFAEAVATAPGLIIETAADLAIDAADVEAAVSHFLASTESRLIDEAGSTEIGTLRWIAPGDAPEIILDRKDGQAIRLGPLCTATMQGLALAMAHLLVAASDAIDEASRHVRRLEADVLYGQPALAKIPIEGLQERSSVDIRNLPTDLVSAAQGSLRRARAWLRESPRSVEGPIADGDEAAPENLFTEPYSGDAAVQESPSPPTIDEETQEARTVGEDNAAEIPVDVSQIARYLSEQLTAVERTYGALPGLEAAMDAGAEDRQVYGSLLRQIMLLLERSEEALRGAGIPPTKMDLPLQPSELANLTLDEGQPLQLLRQAQIAQVLVLEEVVRALDASGQPVELGFAGGGRIEAARFDPSAPGRLRHMVLQLARVANAANDAASRAAGQADVDRRSAEQEWCLRAAYVCAGQGLHEAALLYLMALPRDESSPGNECSELAIRALNEFASGKGTCPPAVAVVLTRWMAQVVAEHSNDPASAGRSGVGPSGVET
ncbi:MAG: hypothetical protein QOI54_2520 [Actinomycetota bacterium]|jgi:hypothetical protein|nr:hypothetical protein [Actinomycetota bacterium]